MTDLSTCPPITNAQLDDTNQIGVSLASSPGWLQLTLGQIVSYVQKRLSSVSVLTSEIVAAGALGNLWNNSGVINVRNANATDTTKPANCFIQAATASGVLAQVYMPGQIITGLSGLTPGATYWLDVTAGNLVTSPPASTGNGVQQVGVALTVNSLMFWPYPMVGPL